MLSYRLLSFALDHYRPQIAYGDRILLPASILEDLASVELTWPLLFSISSDSGKKTHCSVFEFTADENTAQIPFWMMQVLGVQDGDFITIHTVDLPKGTFAKFRPKTIDFFESISNLRTVLEILLKSYSTLTVGDTIPIRYIEKDFFLEIVECKPRNSVSIIETDIQVDFDQPEGYKEPERTQKANEPEYDEIELMIANSNDEDENPVEFEGAGKILNPKKQPKKYVQPIEKIGPKKKEIPPKMRITPTGEIMYEK